MATLSLKIPTLIHNILIDQTSTIHCSCPCWFFPIFEVRLVFLKLVFSLSHESKIVEAHLRC